MGPLPLDSGLPNALFAFEFPSHRGIQAMHYMEYGLILDDLKWTQRFCNGTWIEFISYFARYNIYVYIKLNLSFDGSMLLMSTCFEED